MSRMDSLRRRLRALKASGKKTVEVPSAPEPLGAQDRPKTHEERLFPPTFKPADRLL